MGFDPTMAVKSQYPGQGARGAGWPHEPGRGPWSETKLPGQAGGDDAVVLCLGFHPVFSNRRSGRDPERVHQLLGTWRGCREVMPGGVSGPILVAAKSAGADGHSCHVSSGHGSRRAWGTMVSCLFGANDVRKHTPGFFGVCNQVWATSSENAFSKISKRLYMGQESVYFGTEPLITRIHIPASQGVPPSERRRPGRQASTTLVLRGWPR